MLKLIKNIYYRRLLVELFLRLSKKAVLHNGKLVVYRHTRIRIDKTSKVIINNGTLFIGKPCSFDNFGNTFLCLSNNSIFENSFGGCMFSGSALIGHHSRIVTGFFHINYLSCFRVYNKLTIGNNVYFARNTFLSDSNPHRIIRNQSKESCDYVGEIYIGNDVWIASNVTILKDTVIGNNCVIASGNILTHRIIGNKTLVITKNKEQPIEGWIP